MRLTETVESVVVREATVGEVRAWLARIATAPSADLVDNTPWGGITPIELGLFVDPDEGEPIDNLTPSEIARVAEVAQRLNPDFFRLRALLFPAAPAATEATDSPSSNGAPSG